jgi:hypothetical protein
VPTCSGQLTKRNSGPAACWRVVDSRCIVDGYQQWPGGMPDCLLLMLLFSCLSQNLSTHQRPRVAQRDKRSSRREAGNEEKQEMKRSRK